ncbi:MAG: CopG family transcriptional regulator [Candidatus Freyarchaeota archaeon]
MDNFVKVRVPLDLKEKMRKFEDRVKWSIEIRRFIEMRIQELENKSEMEENLKKVIAIIEKTGGVPKGFFSEAVRTDRDSH